MVYKVVSLSTTEIVGERSNYMGHKAFYRKLITESAITDLICEWRTDPPIFTCLQLLIVMSDLPLPTYTLVAG